MGTYMYFIFKIILGVYLCVSVRVICVGIVECRMTQGMI